jgi:uncharacterized membrane protein YoaK (UPF0700 family)
MKSHRIILIGGCFLAFGAAFANTSDRHLGKPSGDTTHLTGLITDFGVTLGMSVRGFEIPRWKVFVPAVLTVCFFLGGACSCFVTARLQFDTLRIAGFAYVGSGLLWTVSKHVLLPAMQKRLPS